MIGRTPLDDSSRSRSPHPARLFYEFNLRRALSMQCRFHAKTRTCSNVCIRRFSCAKRTSRADFPRQKNLNFFLMCCFFDSLFPDAPLLAACTIRILQKAKSVCKRWKPHGNHSPLSEARQKFRIINFSSAAREGRSPASHAPAPPTRGYRDRG